MSIFMRFIHEKYILEKISFIYGDRLYFSINVTMVVCAVMEFRAILAYVPLVMQVSCICPPGYALAG